MTEITAESLQAKLQAEVKGVEFLTVKDNTECGCGSKFAVVLVAKSFDGMSAVERHQAILGNQGILAEEMKTVSVFFWAKTLMWVMMCFIDFLFD